MSNTAIRTIGLLAVGATLASCTEYTPIYKAGVTRFESENEKAECRIWALQEAPQIIIYEREEIIVGNETVGSAIVPYDLNESRRNQLIRDCLSDLGYARVSIPLCKKEQMAGRSYVPLRVNPEIRPGICAINHGSGRYSIIDLNNPAPG